MHACAYPRVIELSKEAVMLCSIKTNLLPTCLWQTMTCDYNIPNMNNGRCRELN